MAALTGNAIKDTYKDLLQVSNSNSGIDATLRAVSDGEGTDSILKLSSAALEIGTNQFHALAGGQNIMGYNAAIAVSGESAGNTTPIFQVHNNGAGLASFTSWESTVTRPATVVLGRSKGGAIGTLTALSDNDPIGEFSFVGVDVTTTGDMKTIGASIQAVVNGTPAANRMPTDLEFYTALGGADDDIALGAVLGKDAQLDLYGGTISILAGADISAKTRTNSTQKVMRFGVPHYTNAEEPMAIMVGDVNATDNLLKIGGGSSLFNASTVVSILAADDQTTTSGTEVARFEGGAAKATMMGLGNSSLENWVSLWSALQIGGLGSITADTGATTSRSFHLSQNAYTTDGSNWSYQIADEASNYFQFSGTHNFRVASAGASPDDPISWTTALTIANDASATFGGFVGFGTKTELTIASGAITATKSYHSVDTEADAASDDLDTINGGSDGDILIIRAADSARTVVAKDGTGNLALEGDFSMDNAGDRLMLINNDGTSWAEVSRSNNGT